MPADPPAIFSASLAPASLGEVFAASSSAPAAPLGFYTAPTRTPGNVGSVLLTPEAPSGPLGFYTVPSATPGNVGRVLVIPAAPAAPIAPASSVTATPGNVGSVLASPSAPAAPVAPPAPAAPAPANVGAVRGGYASLTINTIRYDAIMPREAETSISIAYADAAANGSAGVIVDTETNIDGVTTDITVYPSEKIHLTITGALYAGPGADNPVVFPVLRSRDIVSGKRLFTSDPLYWQSPFTTSMDRYYAMYVTFGSYWKLSKTTGTDAHCAEWRSSQNVASPDLVTTWVAQGSASGSPVVVALPSTAADIIEAVNFTSEFTHPIITATAVGDVTGSVTSAVPRSWMRFGGTPAATPVTPAAITP